MKKIFILTLLCTLLGFTKTMAQEAYAVYSNGTLTFYYDTQKTSRSGSVYDVTAANDRGWLDKAKHISTVKFDASFQSFQPTTTAGWFYTMTNLTAIEHPDYLDTREVTDMSGMFNTCSSLTELDLSSFNTENVTDMKYMFNDCGKLKTIKFGNAFKTDNVTNMQWMFGSCKELDNLDLTNFETENVRKMDYMFYQCYKLTSLDLSSFNVSSVNDMSYMFLGCNVLQTIYVSSWTLGKATKDSDMFERCYALKGGAGTAYKDNNDNDGSYAHIDGGTGNPGYFTQSFCYDLWVCGKRVLSTNASDILGDGSCYYDDETNTLTFTKSVLASETVVRNEHNHDTSNLTIKITQDLSLLGYGITSINSLILEGPGKLGIYSGEYNSIELSNGAILYVKNLNLETNNSITGIGSAGLVVENDATITASSSQGAIYNLSRGITLNDRAITSPAGATVKDGSIVDADGKVATSVKIGAPTVNLRVAGVGVTSSNQDDILGNGAASYDPTTNTLTLKGSIHGDDKQGIWSNLSGLTIRMATQEAMVTSTGSAAMVLRGNTTIQGPGWLSVKSTSSKGILVSQGATLTVENITLDVLGGGQYGNAISGFDYSSKEKLIIRNAAVTANCNEGNNAIYSFYGGITLEGCSIIAPEGAKLDSDASRFVSASGNMINSVTVGRSFDLRIAGTQVTDLNRFNILGDRTASYDPATNTLTLKGTKVNSGDKTALESYIDGITIYVEGDVEMVCGFATAVTLGGRVTITGPGTLLAKSTHTGNTAGWSGIRIDDKYKGSSLDIIDTRVNAVGQYGMQSWSTAPLYIKNSYVSVTSDWQGITHFTSITLEDVRIVEPEGAKVQGGAIIEENGEYAKNIVILNPADVNQDGTVDSADIVAVIKEMPDGNKKADVNGDGVIDSADIVAVIKAMK